MKTLNYLRMALHEVTGMVHMIAKLHPNLILILVT